MRTTAELDFLKKIVVAIKMYRIVCFGDQVGLCGDQITMFGTRGALDELDGMYAVTVGAHYFS